LSLCPPPPLEQVQGSIDPNLSFQHKHDPENGSILPSDTRFLYEFAENQKMQSAANPELALFAARKAVNTDRVTFKADFLMAPGRKETVDVVAHIGLGDYGEPVLTIMLPEDD
jgi:hypothetical protein